MEEFEKLLESYGLELNFIFEDDRETIEEDIKHIQKSKTEKNAFEGLLYILGELVFRVTDYKKLSNKMNISSYYKNVGPIVEKNFDLNITKKNTQKTEIEFRELDYVSNILEDLCEQAWKEPEKFGMSKNELKLKQMMGQKNLKEEMYDLNEIADKLYEDIQVQEELNKLLSSIETLLKPIPHSPEWYLSQIQKNKIAKELLA